jgi:hypothetical protein
MSDMDDTGERFVRGVLVALPLSLLAWTGLIWLAKHLFS